MSQKNIRQNRKDFTMNPVFQKQIDSPLSGLVVIGYNPIREVPIIELRNNKSSSTDSSNMFYRMHLLSFTEENNFSLRRYYRIQKIAQRYVHYSIAYSFQSKEAIEKKIRGSEFSNHILFPSKDVIAKIRRLDFRLITSKVLVDICRKDKLFQEIKYEKYEEFTIV
jgi:hypothetical protein